MQKRIKLNCVSLVLALNLIAVCVANAQTELYFNASGDYSDTNWSTAGNWPGNSLPGPQNSANYTDGFSVTVSAHNAANPNGLTVDVQEADASGGQFRLRNSNLTISSGNELTVGGLATNSNLSTGTSNIINNGTLESTDVVYFNRTSNFTNDADASFTSTGFNVNGTATITNSGDMNIGGYLYLATGTGNNTWYMNGGTINANRIVMIDGGSATLNLDGGTINATVAIDFRANDTNYNIIVGAGELVVNGNELTTFNDMLDGLNPTLRAKDSSRTVAVTYDSVTKKTTVELAAIPEPAHVTLVMGLFALLYLPLSARKVAI